MNIEKEVLIISPVHPNDGEVAYFDLALIRVYKKIKRHHTCEIIFNADTSDEKLLNYILSLNPDIIIVNPYRNNLIDSVRLLNNINNHIPECIKIIVGWYAEPDYLSNYITDIENLYIFCGEIEELLPDIIDKLQCHNKFTFKEMKYFHKHGEKRSEKHLFYFNHRYSGNDNTGDLQPLYRSEERLFGWVEIARGCKFQCSFCIASSYNNRAYRERPVENIKREIHELYKRGVREFGILSSAINYNYKLMKNVFGILRKFRDPVSVSGTIHPAFINDDTVLLIKSVKWRTMIVGLQTINPAAQININRKMNPDVFREKILNISSFHIPEVEIILGLPGDNKEGFIKTVEFLLGLPVSISVYHLRIEPWSVFYFNRERFGFNIDYRNYGKVISNFTFSQKEINSCIKYLRNINLRQHKAKSIIFDGKTLSHSV